MRRLAPCDTQRPPWTTPLAHPGTEQDRLVGFSFILRAGAAALDSGLAAVRWQKGESVLGNDIVDCMGGFKVRAGKISFKEGFSACRSSARSSFVELCEMSDDTLFERRAECG